MALILDTLYDALKAAGASEEQARAAARDVAAYDHRLNRIERDLNLLKWMLGVLIALVIGVFWMQWQTLDQIARLGSQVDALDERFGIVAQQLSGLEDRLGRLEVGLGRIEDQLPE